MIRWIVRALAILVFAVAALVVLDYAELLVPEKLEDSSSMADTLPGCDARILAEGITYRLWDDPDEGDVVVVHAAVTDDGQIVPDRDADDRTLALRVIGEPGDVVDVRDGNVYVDDIRVDEIETEPFEAVTVPSEQYFLLGDNRSNSVDSRTFGTVREDAIFGRVFAVFWPARDITLRLDREAGAPVGPIRCS